MTKRVALVTGGLKGIGGAITEYLTNNNFIVYATTRGQIPDINSKDIIPVKMDVTIEQSIKQVYRQINENHGALDTLVNNAGTGTFQSFEKFEPNDWNKIFHTNTFGVFYCTKHAFPLMEKHGGRIINISSISTKRALPYNTVYAASKHAINGFGQALAEEWHKHRIFVTNIVLGATYTDIWKGLEGFSREEMLHVNDVARVVDFVANTPLNVRIDELTVTPSKGIL